MTYRKLGLLSALVAVIVAVFVSATGASASSQPQQIQDAQMQVLTTTFGGASVLPTTRTVQHWWGSTLDPHNGITYGYNMVGADPNTCAGSACSATVTGDIIPLNRNGTPLIALPNSIDRDLGQLNRNPRLPANEAGSGG